VGRETNKQRRAKQAATARDKAAAARAIARRQEQRRRAVSILSTVGVIAVVGVIIAVFAVNAGSKSGGSTARTPANKAVLSELTGVSQASLASIGQGTAQLLAKPASDPPLTANGKPELLYVGGEFCPFCAAERWSMVQALSRFGTFTGLREIRSAVTDSDIATFTFYKSTYRSKYLSFVPIENEDRDRKLLEPLTKAQQAIFTKYTNGFPFLDFGGKYTQTNAGYDPTDLSGLNQQQIASKLSDPTSKITTDILGEANVVTATICKMTNNQPASVCDLPDITNLQGAIGA
jgi:thiol-disulfide isomerase/thioredoxin